MSVPENVVKHDPAIAVNKFPNHEGIEMKSDMLVDVFRPNAVGEFIEVASLLRVPARVQRVDIALYDFRMAFEESIESSVPAEQRMTQSTDRIRVLSLDRPGLIDSQLKTLRRVANDSPETWTPHVRSLYLQALKDICVAIHQNGAWNVDAHIVPLRGGAIIASLIEEYLGHSLETIPIDSKRVAFPEQNHVGLALRLASRFDDSTEAGLVLGAEYIRKMKGVHGKKIRVLEAAVASGLTSIGYLLELSHYDIKPQHIEVLTPVASYKGVNTLLEVAEFLGYNISINTGQLFYRLGNFWEDTADSIQYDDGEYVIGAATNILEPFLRETRFELA